MPQFGNIFRKNISGIRKIDADEVTATSVTVSGDIIGQHFSGVDLLINGSSVEGQLSDLTTNDEELLSEIHETQASVIVNRDEIVAGFPTRVLNPISLSTGDITSTGALSVGNGGNVTHYIKGDLVLEDTGTGNNTIFTILTNTGSTYAYSRSKVIYNGTNRDWTWCHQNYGSRHFWQCRPDTFFSNGYKCPITMNEDPTTGAVCLQAGGNYMSSADINLYDLDVVENARITGILDLGDLDDVESLIDTLIIDVTANANNIDIVTAALDGGLTGYDLNPDSILTDGEIAIRNATKSYLRLHEGSGWGFNFEYDGGSTNNISLYAEESGVNTHQVFKVSRSSGTMSILQQLNVGSLTNVESVINGKAAAAHSHIISDVTGLQTLLDTKSAIGHGHLIADVTGLQTVLDTKSQIGHGHLIADTAGLQTAIDGKSAIGHGHLIADVTGLQIAIDGKSDTGHGHVIADVTGLQIAIDGKSDTGHGHVIANVTGLQTAIDGKSDTGHGHVIANVTGLQTAIDGKSDTGHSHNGETVEFNKLTLSGAEETPLVVRSSAADMYVTLRANDDSVNGDIRMQWLEGNGNYGFIQGYYGDTSNEMRFYGYNNGSHALALTMSRNTGNIAIPSQLTLGTIVDVESDVNTNAQGIASNLIAIGTNSSSIGILNSGINNNSTAIGIMGDRVTVNEVDMVTVENRVTVTESDIVTVDGIAAANATAISDHRHSGHIIVPSTVNCTGYITGTNISGSTITSSGSVIGAQCTITGNLYIGDVTNTVNTAIGCRIPYKSMTLQVVNVSSIYKDMIMTQYDSPIGSNIIYMIPVTESITIQGIALSNDDAGLGVFDLNLTVSMFNTTSTHSLQMVYDGTSTSTVCMGYFDTPINIECGDTYKIQIKSPGLSGHETIAQVFGIVNHVSDISSLENLYYYTGSSQILYLYDVFGIHNINSYKNIVYHTDTDSVVINTAATTTYYISAGGSIETNEATMVKRCKFTWDVLFAGYLKNVLGYYEVFTGLFGDISGTDWFTMDVTRNGIVTAVRVNVNWNCS